MATILFSALSNGQTISFNPLVDVLNFDSASISAASLQPQTDDFGTSFQVTAAGKTIFFPPGFNVQQFTTTNVTFADGSALLVGDNTTGTANDNGPNTLTGTAHADLIGGFGGNDTINAGGGDDRIFMTALNGSDGGSDVVDGGAGFDTVLYESNTPVTVNLLAGTGHQAGGGISTLTGVEAVRGSSFGDTLIGANNSDTLDGGNGNDTLRGAAGNDILIGGDGDDALIGESFNDTLTGGAGNDKFIYSTALTTVNTDTITDFQSGADSIQLDASVLTGLTQNGVVNLAQFAAGPAVTATSAAQRILYNTSTGDVSYDSDGTGAAAPVKLFTLSGAPALSAADFLVFNGAGNYAWSTLVDGSTYLYNPATNVLNFNDTSISASDRDMITWTGNDVVFSVEGKGNPALNKTVHFTIAGGGKALTDTNVTYADGSKLLIGDNTTGTANDDAVNTLTGAAGNDRFIGLGGNDTLNGNAGNDTFVLNNGASAFGNDTVNGGAGLGDAIGVGTHPSILHGSTVDFTFHTVTSVDGTASFSNIENAFGTDLDDTFITVDASRVLTGLGAANGNFDFGRSLRGYAGNDTFNGDNRDGYFEQVTYTDAPHAVVVNLSTGVATDGYDSDLVTPGFQPYTDTLVNIDGVQGSAFNDVLVGGGTGTTFNGTNFEQLEGMAGSDTLNANGATNVRAEYLSSPNGVTVNLATGTANDGWGGTDALIGIAGVRGSNFDDALTGDANNNFLEGRGGNDNFNGGAGTDSIFYSAATSAVTIDLALGSSSLTGGQGTDTWVNIEGVRGGDFNDTLSGADGVDNVLEGRAGADQLDGRSGTDLARYDFSPSSVVVDLAAGLAADGYDSDPAAGIQPYIDTLVSIERVRGSKFADTLTGDAGANGFEGWAGNDNIDGGTGIDTAEYRNSPAAVTVNLTTGTASDGWGGTDTLTSIENLAGSAFNDTLTGDAQDNVFEGGAGNDVLNGAAGTDTASYARAGGNVTVSLALTTQQNTGGDGSDTLLNIENLTGSGFNDNLTGNAQNNVLEGGAGDDVLNGAAGNDTASYADAGGPVTVTLALTTPQDTLGAGTDTLLNVENVTGSAFGDNLQGNAGNNVLSGGAGGDLIRADAGDDVLDGGAGADTLIYSAATAGVTVNLGIVGPQDTGALGQDTLTGFEFLNGSSFDDILTGDTGANFIFGDFGNDLLDGGAGNDTLNGGAGNDTASYASASGAVVASLASGQATGAAGTDAFFPASIENLTGSGFDDTLTGDGNANVLNGGAGTDALLGGGGNDSYVVDNVADVVTENLAQGTDLIQSSVTYSLALAANVENLTLTGVAAINGTGNTVANILTGNAGDNVLDGAAGADTLIGGAGNDTYIVNNLGDVVTEAAAAGTDLVQSSVAYTLGANLENLTLTGAAINGTGNTGGNVITGNAAANVLDGGAGADTVIGGTGNDTLIGGTGDDVLNGGTGADTITGGLGNDTYVVDNVSDVVIENLAEGTDIVQSSVTYTLALAGNVENLTLTGVAAINGTGNAGVNVITGNAAANVLDGGAQRDTLVGGAGNDTLIGGTSNDTLIGETGNDLLNGGTGTDTMGGGLGNDTYVVDNVTDVVTENLAEGTDLVQSSVAYTLGANLEDLTLTGAAINGTGNAGVNVITGNAAANVLDGGAQRDTLTGGAGNDTLIGGTSNDTLIGETGNDVLNGGTGADTMGGGLGNDTYVVDNATDLVTENLAEGTDLVQSSVTYTLGANLENLTLTGATAINGTGNEFNNVITGNAANNTLSGGTGNDTLDGGAGSDTLSGGAGNDTYVVNSASDVVTENVGEGTDTVFSSGGRLLDANVENLTLTGTAVNGTGNAGNNVLTGNASNNTLNGGAGNDTLIGGAGNDTLIGGASGDQFVFDSMAGADSVTDFVSGTDKFAFSQAGIHIGNGDTAINGVAFGAGPGGFLPSMELVVMTNDIAGAINTTNASAAIGSAAGAYAVGDTCLFVVDNGTASDLFLFTSSETDAVVSAAELTLVGVVTNTPAIAPADFIFVA